MVQAEAESKPSRFQTIAFTSLSCLEDRQRCTGSSFPSHLGEKKWSQFSNHKRLPGNSEKTKDIGSSKDVERLIDKHPVSLSLRTCRQVCRGLP